VRLVGVLLAVIVSACSARSLPEVAPSSAKPVGVAGVRAPEDSLETFMKKVRTLSAEARLSRTELKTIEATDPYLAAALAASLVQPTAETYRGVAVEYQRLGVGDRAFEYLSKALKINASDWHTYDALARLWRDQGFANLALGDAYRAVHYAPSSAAAQNTLGTIFQALGRRADAARQYQLTLKLDPTAAYALSNLCYTRMLSGEGGAAIAACEQAVALEPSLIVARNNLALAHAANGNFARAEGILRANGTEPAGDYNVGMVNLARGRYQSAVSAFTAAQVARPAWRLAAARRRQAESALERRTE
jgi:Flp pilus assembly protein TadD